MVQKLNCWEFMDCGYARRGDKTDIGGICPVLSANEYDGINDGKSGGRYCWNVKEAFCQMGGGSLNVVLTLTCFKCDFYRYVHDQQKAQFRA
jgi:hypothetical protein